MDVREREFENLHIRLREHQQHLLHRVNQVKREIETPDADEGDLEEEAQEAAREALLNALDEQTRSEYVRVNAALARMDADEYGECVDCGDEIQLARLKAIPWAFRCVECARKHQD